MSLSPDILVSVAVQIQVPVPPTATTSAGPKPEAEVTGLAPSLASLSLTSERSGSPRKGRIIVHCIRHAESFCNLKEIPDAHLMPNPGLTDEGVKQAEDLLENILESKRMDNIDFILASPLERTLQTAMIAFEPALEKRLKIIAYPDLRENGKIPSSKGASLEDLKIYKNVVDLGLVEEGWETKYDVSRRYLRDGRSRDAKVRKELWRLGSNALQKTEERWKHLVVGGREDETRNVEIVVVTHGGFLFELLDVKGRHFYNAECRSYELSQTISRTGKTTHKLEDLPASEQLAPRVKKDAS